MRFSPIALFTAAFMVMSGAALAGGGSYQVGQLLYANCGSYSVSKFQVHWKYEGEKYKTSSGHYIEGDGRWFKKGEGVCFDLEKIGVPQGAEVWLTFKIDGGDKINCRKDNTKFYYDAEKPTSTGAVFSKGETLTNNRCRLGSTKVFNVSKQGCDASIKSACRKYGTGRSSNN